MNILCALGFHKESKGIYEEWHKRIRGKKGPPLRRHYAICKRCGKRRPGVKSHERQ